MLKIWKFIFFVVLLFQHLIELAAAQSINATKSNQVLELSQVIESIRDHYPLVLAAQQKIEKAKGSLTSAEGNFDTKFKVGTEAKPDGFYDSRRIATGLEQPTKILGATFFGTYALSDGDFPSYEGDLVTHDGGELRAGFELPLFKDSQIDDARASLVIAKSEVELAGFGVKQTLLETSLQASAAYVDWVSAGQRRQVYARLLEVAVERSGQLAQRLNLGDISEFDLLDNQRAELQRRSQLAEAEQQIQSAAIRLSLFLRDETGQPIVVGHSSLPRSLKFDLPLRIDSIAKAVSIAFENRPEIKNLLLRREQLDLKQKLSQNKLLPALDLKVYAAQNLGQGLKENDETEVYTGLQFELPLQLNDAKGQLAQTQAEITENERLLELLKQRIEANIRDLWQSVELSKKRMNFAEEELKAAVQLEEGEVAKFKLGDSNLIFVNLREQTTSDASVRAISARADYYKTELSLTAALSEIPG